MPFGWAAPAITKSEEVEGLVRAGVIAVIFDGLGNLLGRAIGDVGVGGGEMAENFRAVYSLPPKGVVGNFVDAVPAQLLGGKGRDIEFLKDLGEGGTIAKDIGQEHVHAIDAEFVAKILATIEELPDEGFSAGEIAVGFDPHGANGFPVAGLDGFFDSIEELRVVLFEPFVLAGLAVDV